MEASTTLRWHRYERGSRSTREFSRCDPCPAMPSSLTSSQVPSNMSQLEYSLEVELSLTYIDGIQGRKRAISTGSIKASTSISVRTICVATSCEGICASGTADCLARYASTGCQTDLGSDPSHCGTCRRACPSDQVCRDGVCAALACTCAGPHVLPACTGQTCTGACVLGFAQCNGEQGCASDVSWDPNNCGGCGARCPSGAFCLAGKCAGRDSLPSAVSVGVSIVLYMCPTAEEITQIKVRFRNQIKEFLIATAYISQLAVVEQLTLTVPNVDWRVGDVLLVLPVSCLTRQIANHAESRRALLTVVRALMSCNLHATRADESLLHRSSLVLQTPTY